MAYHANDSLNHRIFDAVFHAQLSRYLGGRPRRDILTHYRRRAHGQFAKVLDRVLNLDTDQQDRFFEAVMRDYGL